jgi:hypothetical protein
MSEWWTYRLEDFLLFSENVYWRLFELHNEAVWPAQIPALLLGAAIVLFLLWPYPWSSRVIALILAVVWIFVAWSFLWNRYATINWAAQYAVPLFLAEALLLTWIGGVLDQLTIRLRKNVGSLLGLVLFAYALLLHPLISVAAGRPPGSAEIFAIAPDPTAIATLGIVAMAKPGIATWLLLPVPLVWCALSAATLLAMGTWEASVPLTAIAVVLVAGLWPRATSLP